MSCVARQCELRNASVASIAAAYNTGQKTYILRWISGPPVRRHTAVIGRQHVEHTNTVKYESQWRKYIKIKSMLF